MCPYLLLIMVALCNRADHYIFALWFLSFFFFFFFPRLISSVGDRMSTILPHMAWPQCEFRIRSEMCCTRLAENTGRKKSPFWHHRTTLSGCIFAAEACIQQWASAKLCGVEQRAPPIFGIWRASRWASAHILVGYIRVSLRISIIILLLRTRQGCKVLR